MPDYDGPERRKTTLAQLLAMQKSMEDLSHEVGRLTGELETLNEVSRRQDTVEASTRKERLRQRRTNVLLAVALIGFGVVGANDWVSGHHTSTRFNSFQQQSFNNCETRDMQAVGTKNLVNLFIGLIPDDGKPSDIQLHQGLTEFEKTIPGPIDCNKLR